MPADHESSPVSNNPSVEPGPAARRNERSGIRTAPTPNGTKRYRIQAIVDMIYDGAKQSEIVERMTKDWNVRKRTIKRYLEVARARVIGFELSCDNQTAKAMALAWYSSLVGNKDANIRDRLTARIRMDKLLGLEAPTQSVSASIDLTELAGLTEEQRAERIASIVTSALARAKIANPAIEDKVSDDGIPPVRIDPAPS